jgi:hypothetical protein
LCFFYVFYRFFKEHLVKNRRHWVRTACLLPSHPSKKTMAFRSFGYGNLLSTNPL